MKAIILAGGEGTRLRPVTWEIPKPLLSVGRKPIINYLIDLFSAHDISEVMVVIRPHDKDEFAWWKARWGNSFNGVNVSLSEEVQPMGTFGQWVHALQSWTGKEPFILTNGDELKEMDLTAMADFHAKSGGLATVALVKVSNPSEYGVAVLHGSHIREFIEKPKDPPSEFISSGLYIIDPKVAEYVGDAVANNQRFLMVEKDLFPKLAKDGKLIAYHAGGRWYDCGNFERWEKAIKEWPKGNFDK